MVAPLPFSRRTDWDRTVNALSARLEALRAQGARVVDLTESNPTRCGLGLTDSEVARALGAAGVSRYAPEPFGLREAREAVAAHLARGGARVDAADLILTASTSEAYGFLFKLLCDPGDSVAVFTPGYPLLEFLARLESVELARFPLDDGESWASGLSMLRASAIARLRAVVVVNPNNPTGHFITRGDLERLASLCAERGWALVADEVFSDYGIGADADLVRTLAGLELPCLSFSLSGLSKVAAAPQLKLGWICAGGPEAARREALARLELVADSYLSVSTPVQLAAPRLLSLAPGVQERIRDRVAQNRAALVGCRPPDASWDVLPAEGGWYAVVRLPERADEEALCLELLDAGAVVHPGHFFDYSPRRPRLVLSLLPEPDPFRDGALRLARVLASLG